MAGNEYDFWVFDLDGTIVDIDPDYPREVIGEVGDRLGVGFTDREVESLWYGMGASRGQCLRRHGVDPGLFWEVFHEVEDPIERAGATFVYDDAESFVTSREGPVGIVTHCQEYLTGPVLDRHDMTDWFDTVVCCCEEVGWKPDPAPVEAAMVDMGVGYNGHEGAMVGDDPDDIGAAWNAGLDGIHVERHDPQVRGQCVLGDQRVDSFTELS